MTPTPTPDILRRTAAVLRGALLLMPLAACGGTDVRPTTAAAQDTPPPPRVEVVQRAPPKEEAPVAAHSGECEVRCIVAEGARAVDQDAADRVGDSLGGMFDNLRACMRQAGMNHAYTPMVTLRFSASGQNSAVGVDTAGYEGAEPCLTSTVLGSGSGVNVAGAAVIRCSEGCARTKHRKR